MFFARRTPVLSPRRGIAPVQVRIRPPDAAPVSTLRRAVLFYQAGETKNR
jgi:hypothetical protein